MFTKTIYIIFLSFFFVYNTYDVIRKKIENNGFLITGLVHSAIAILFGFVQIFGSNVVAEPFSAFSILLFFLINFKKYFYFLPIVCEVFTEKKYPASSILSCIAGSLTYSESNDLVPFLFHRSFISSIVFLDGKEPILFFSVINLILSISSFKNNYSNASFFYASSFIRGIIQYFESGVIEAEFFEHILVYKSKKIYYVCVVLYSIVLVIQTSMETFGYNNILILTEFTHLAAVIGSLVAIIPNVLGFFPHSRMVILFFPLCDILLSAYEIYTEHNIILYFRIASLILLIGSFFTSVERCETCSEIFENKKITPGSKTALILYGLCHTIYSIQTDSFEESLHILFHTVVISLSFSYYAIQTSSSIYIHISITFLIFETIALIIVQYFDISNGMGIRKKELLVFTSCIFLLYFLIYETKYMKHIFLKNSIFSFKYNRLD